MLNRFYVDTYSKRDFLFGVELASLCMSALCQPNVTAALNWE